MLAVFCTLLLSVLGQVSPTKTIYQNLEALPLCASLVAILNNPNYAAIKTALSSPGTLTLFAPDNLAFTQTAVDTDNVALTSDILLYHVIGATVKSTDLGALQFPQTLLTDPKYVILNGNPQVIDVYKTGSTVYTNWGLPTNFTQTAQVIDADIISSNGVIHVINRVQLLPVDVATTCQWAGLTTLLTAVVKAGLATAITTTPQLTVFAPTNQAFSDAGIDPNLLTPDQLTPVLTYHVVPAVAFSVDLKDGQVVPTLNGETLRISVTASGVQVIDSKGSAANVIIANTIVNNGVVHVIDKVLIP